MTEIKPKTTLTSKITTGGALLLAIVAIVMNAGLIGQEDIYICQAREIAMHCDSLSKVNSDGFQTRCYYQDEIENKTRYRNCKTGWLSYTPESKKLTNLTNSTRVYLICEKQNNLISLCQIINSNETIYKLGGSNGNN